MRVPIPVWLVQQHNDNSYQRFYNSGSVIHNGGYTVLYFCRQGIEAVLAVGGSL